MEIVRIDRRVVLAEARGGEGHLDIAGIQREVGQRVLVINARCAIGTVGIGGLAPAEDFATTTDIVLDVAVAQDQVITVATLKIVIAGTAENFVIACAAIDGVITVARVDNVIVSKFSGQDCIPAINAVAIGIRAGQRCDQVIACTTFNNAGTRVGSPSA